MVWAAFFNVVAIFIFHLNVAATVGKGIVDPGVVDHHVIFGALVGAIAWNLITWYYGIPSSSSHALIGGIVGAVDRQGRHRRRCSRPGIFKTASFIFISPLLGLLLGALLMVLVSWICLRARRRGASTAGSGGCSSSRPPLYSLGHGGNDAQKTMGIIWLLLIAAGVDHARTTCPTWVDRQLLRRDRARHACSAAGASSRPWARRSPS